MSCVFGVCLGGACHCNAGIRGPLCNECIEAGYVLNLQSGLCVFENRTEPEVCTPRTGGCLGDPHCTTLDGSAFDFHGHCEYTLLHTFCPDKPATTVQVRQSAWPGAAGSGGATVVSAAAMQETFNGNSTSVVEIVALAEQSVLQVLLDGAVLVAEGGGEGGPTSVSLGPEASLQVGSSWRSAVVRFASGIVVTVQLSAHNNVTGALAVQVQATQPASVCRCSEGLLGFADNSLAREYLLPGPAYRSAADVPLLNPSPSSLTQFASIPSPDIPSFLSYGERWRLQSAVHNASQRLFHSAEPDACSVPAALEGGAYSLPAPLDDACGESGAAVACCTNASARLRLACLTDFCKIGSCNFTYPPIVDPCDFVSCATGQCVGGVCVCSAETRGVLCDECTEPGLVVNTTTGACENRTVEEGCGSRRGLCTADLRCQTFDGSLATFFGGRCEYTLLHTFCASRPETIVQVQAGPWVAPDATAAVVTAVGLQENSGMLQGAILEVRPSPDRSGLRLWVNSVLYEPSALVAAETTAFAEGSVLALGSGRTLVVQFRSGHVVTMVLALADTFGVGVAVTVDLNGATAGCGCTEGLLGFADGVPSRDFLLPVQSYRRSDSLPLAPSAFAAIPSAAVPSASVFGERWRLQSANHTASIRLFQGRPPASCSDVIVPPLPCNPPSHAALECCERELGQPTYSSCLADYCRTNTCVVDPPGL